MYIAIDFDGTLADRAFPHIGDEVPGAFDWLRRFRAAGAGLILWTMRSDRPEVGPVLTEAVGFCRDRGVVFDGVNASPVQGTSASPKAYADLYIDDAAFGCPMLDNPRPGGRPYADWSRIGPAVLSMLKA